jgi:hypothetical protein
LRLGVISKKNAHSNGRARVGLSPAPQVGEARFFLIYFNQNNILQ